MSTQESPPVSPARQLADFVGRFEPAVARVVRACRTALHRRLPTAIEQVYDNYNFLAIGFCSSERTSDCILSLAVSPRGVALVVLLRSDAAGSSSSAGRQRHPEPLRAARKRRGARDAGRRGVDCGGNRAGPGAAPGHRRRLPDDQVGIGEAAAPPENGGSRTRTAAPPDRPEAVAGEAARTIGRQGGEPPLLRSRVGAARCTTPRCQPPGPGSSRRSRPGTGSSSPIGS